MGQLVFNEKKVLVFGWARSGKAAAKRLLDLGAKVTVINRDPYPDDTDYQQLLAAGVEFVIGDQAEQLSPDFAYIVKNPGINYDHPLVQKALVLKIPILTEVAVALSTFQGRLITVTGSNGKTTTTSLIGEMLKTAGVSVTVAGNIGTPVCEVVGALKSSDTLLLELSSFQLLGIPAIQPDIALITNIFTNHIDYHKTRENYVAAKFRITKDQRPDQVLVLNAQGADSPDFATKTAAQVYEFSRQESPTFAHVNQTDLIVDGQTVLPLNQIRLVGPQNLENILAAVAVAQLAGVPTTAMAAVLKSFGGVPHRLQHLFDRDGVAYYNDSKATDIEATQAALDSFTKPTIWLAGGLDRGDDLMRLAPNLKHVKGVIAFGQTQQKVVELARSQHLPVITAIDVERAAPMAIKLAQPGDVVLLSPAAASWDQYDNFEVRGEVYTQALQEAFEQGEN
ncbi:UDP-N-acetylmuramoyl-L-alanine--D-glutamate ligase [Convivina intestini]|uniref:UDP-N-acetylmuramoylalanine--D-glutamate ligase n=1 Tax=Convivina intestini TaxID=1505726 RepID=A0A2U1D903_9LACO|nr:UDP-N-acetylmuramoyl-L-alanine--D-glutamate ligase [Convivina intestini]PVY84166.1 UDP-N-acetylmuramoylalanine--D-glutamate ligase [Convivina intestini]CAH1854333.1 UDP-N-acetylmuramoylalanine--D-glutamate ligase [Convivina intestini]SDB91100.1 UDP-N-acetylmuramoylalanine--D-glutamate ligase [Leuconostocaceae bacterium R-53105]